MVLLPRKSRAPRAARKTSTPSVRRGFLAVFCLCLVLGFVGAWGLRLFSSSLERGDSFATFIEATPPRIAFTSQPTLVESRSLSLSYMASGDGDITKVFLRVTPHNPLPGANNASVDISLPAPKANRILRTDIEDMLARPWSGQPVSVQLVATNEAGLQGVTKSVEVAMPSRDFSHPLARVLVQERLKLMQDPDNNALREEAANLMASIAHQPANFGGDPVVLMALRGGAVRLVLGRSHDAVVAVNDLLWYAAVRLDAMDKRLNAQQVVKQQDMWRDLAWF